MKRGKSTGKPTKAESERIEAVKSGPCLACIAWGESGNAPWGFHVTIGCDAHHLLSGGRRIGHMATVGLCPWHHRQVPDWGCTAKEMRAYYGPSLMDGSKTFRDTYGDDESLMKLQNELLGAE